VQHFSLTATPTKIVSLNSKLTKPEVGQKHLVGFGHAVHNLSFFRDIFDVGMGMGGRRRREISPASESQCPKSLSSESPFFFFFHPWGPLAARSRE